MEARSFSWCQLKDLGGKSRSLGNPCCALPCTTLPVSDKASHCSKAQVHQVQALPPTRWHGSFMNVHLSLGLLSLHQFITYQVLPT